MKKQLVLFLLVLGFAATAQARVVRGTVKDMTGETVIAASVVVQGTSIGTITDLDGNYTLDVPDGATTLVFSYIQTWTTAKWSSTIWRTVYA